MPITSWTELEDAGVRLLEAIDFCTQDEAILRRDLEARRQQSQDRQRPHRERIQQIEPEIARFILDHRDEFPDGLQTMSLARVIVEWDVGSETVEQFGRLTIEDTLDRIQRRDQQYRIRAFKSKLPGLLENLGIDRKLAAKIGGGWSVLLGQFRSEQSPYGSLLRVRPPELDKSGVKKAAAQDPGRFGPEGLKSLGLKIAREPRARCKPIPAQIANPPQPAQSAAA